MIAILLIGFAPSQAPLISKLSAQSQSGEQPALSSSINGPSDIAYFKGHLYVMEIVGGRLLDIDLMRGTAEAVLSQPIDSTYETATELGPFFALTASPTGNVFVGDVAGRLADVDVSAHSATVKRSVLLNPFPQIGGMAWDDLSGTVILLDRHTVLRWTPETNQLERIAGSAFGFSGDGGPAKNAQFKWPQGIAINRLGDILIADTENCRLRKIEAKSETISTIAGGQHCDSTGDGQDARNAKLNNPRKMVIDARDNIFISEGCRVRLIDPAGIISTYAGGKSCGFSGDNGAATAAQINADGLAVDHDGNLYISDFTKNRIRRVDVHSHTITTIAGNGLPNRMDVFL